MRPQIVNINDHFSIEAAHGGQFAVNSKTLGTEQNERFRPISIMIDTNGNEAEAWNKLRETILDLITKEKLFIQTNDNAHEQVSALTAEH